GRRLGVGGRILEALEVKPREMSLRRSAPLRHCWCLVSRVRGIRLPVSQTALRRVSRSCGIVRMNRWSSIMIRKLMAISLLTAAAAAAPAFAGGSIHFGIHGGGASWGINGGTANWGTHGGGASWGPGGGSANWGTHGGGASWGPGGGSASWGTHGVGA